MAAVGIVALVGTMVVRVTNPSSFLWFGATFLLAAFAFGATSSVAHSGAFPRIQAAAVLMKGSDLGVRGYYVAETSDQDYLARITVDRCVNKGARGEGQDARLNSPPSRQRHCPKHSTSDGSVQSKGCERQAVG